MEPRFIQLNATALQAYVHSEEFESAEYIAISRHRALAQLANPLVQAEDVLLVVVYDHKQLIGYLGIVPSELPNGVRFGTMSSLWLAPRARGKGLSDSLFKHADRAWDHRLLAGDYVPKTWKMYVRTGLFGTTPFVREGVRLYMKSTLADILPPKLMAIPYFQDSFIPKIKTVLRGLDVMINGIIGRLPSRPAQLQKLSLCETQSLTEQQCTFIQEHPAGLRSVEELKWMLANPWVLQTPAPTRADKHYYFSATARQFQYHIVSVAEMEDLIAVLIFQRKGGRIKLPYLFCRKGKEKQLIQPILTQLHKWNASTFTTFDARLAPLLQQARTPRIVKKPTLLHYVVSEEFRPMFTRFTLQDGDGDLAFT